MVKENVDGVMRLGCSVGGGIDQDEMMNPFSEGNLKVLTSRSLSTKKNGLIFGLYKIIKVIVEFSYQKSKNILLLIELDWRLAIKLLQ